MNMVIVLLSIATLSALLSGELLGGAILLSATAIVNAIENL